MSGSKAKFSHPIPAVLAHLPLDARGYPIPHGVWRNPETGEHDFRIVDPDKRLHALRERLCAISGRPLTKGQYWFIGGLGNFRKRIFMDGPMLLEAAEFSLRTCPHLALSSSKYRSSGLEQVHAKTRQSTDKQELFLLAMAPDFDLVDIEGGVYVHAHSWKAVSLWRDAEPLSAEDTQRLLAEQPL